MRRAGLRAKVARLERQTQERRWPKVCSAIYDCEADIIGIGDNASIHLVRKPGESLQQLAARAFAKFGDVRNLAAIYRENAPPELPGRDVDQIPSLHPKQRHRLLWTSLALAALHRWQNCSKWVQSRFHLNAYFGQPNFVALHQLLALHSLIRGQFFLADCLAPWTSTESRQKLDGLSTTCST